MPINLLTENDFTPKSFAAARQAFGGKAPLTSDQYDRLTVKQRRRGFRIAGVNNARLVQQIRNSLQRAIDEGTTFADWRKQVFAMFKGQGIPRVSASRLRQAFLQNTLQSYSDARRDTLDRPEIVKAFVYRQYLTKDDRRVRPTHADLDNKIFRATDPFWDLFTPPWEFGCRCTFIALTAGQVKRSRATIWTLSGGRVRPVGREKKKADKSFRLKPNPSYDASKLVLSTAGLDSDLAKLVEALTNE